MGSGNPFLGVDNNIKGQVYNVAGAPVGGEFLINSQTFASQTQPSVVRLPDGGFVVTWESADPAQDGDLTAIKAQVFDASGAPIGTEFLVNTAVASFQYLASVAALTDGSIVVTWTTEDQAQDGEFNAIKARVFDPAGGGGNQLPSGSVTITGNAVEDATLTAANTLADADGLGAISYQWLRDGQVVAGQTSGSYMLAQADVGHAISVRASYIDGGGTAESVTSAATAMVSNVNDAPLGAVAISGNAIEDAVLTASNLLADEDGLGPIGYQWLRAGRVVAGATDATYTLGQVDVGHAISVRASYTDGFGTPESVTSAPTDVVANLNDSPTGTVTIAGTAVEDATLTATNTLADEDGLGPIAYQWLRDGQVIAGETTGSYTLGQVDVGHAISVRASYTDGFGTPESVTSAPTDVVANLNDAPTGTVTIDGTAVEDATLTAANTLADEDGLGPIAYQWLRDGQEIGGATGQSYTLGQADVGHQVAVRASYTDGQGTLERVSSTPSAAVANLNDAPTGTLTITGIAEQRQVLSASNNLADEDGLGAFSYQWLRDGNPITNATAATYTLRQGDVGHDISVRAIYTDGGGTLESVTSAPSGPVANVNDAPVINFYSGLVALSEATPVGTVIGTYRAFDLDGDSFTFSFDDPNVPFAVDPQSGVVTLIAPLDFETVQSYDFFVRATDPFGAVGTHPVGYIVTNGNDAPTGSVTITGTAAEDQVLTASNTLADGDGIGAISYQWLRGSTPIAGATGITYAPTQADVGGFISVRASYVDQEGTAEAVTSAPTALVANVNDPGLVAVLNTALQGVTLQASNVVDEDGIATPIAFQWLRDGTPISGATGSSYTLRQADVGTQVAIRASYTDNYGTAEIVTSAPTAQVANVNDAPWDIFASGNALIEVVGNNINNVRENLGNGSFVALLRGVDLDGDLLTYTLIDDAGGRFRLLGDSGFTSDNQLVVAASSLLDYEQAQAHQVTVRVTDPSGASRTEIFTVNLTNIVENQNLTLTAGNDTFIAPSDDHWTIDGLAGLDVIVTLGGNDRITGGVGDDRIDTGGGNDTIVYRGTNTGFDIVIGGDGLDTILATARNTVIGLRSASGIESVSSGGFNGVYVQGSDAGDTLDFSNAVLNGIGSIRGGAGNDTIRGGSGADRILGEGGADILFGGSDADTFAFGSLADIGLGATADLIGDFQRGVDRIDLSAIDARSATNKNDAFTFIGSQNFGNVAGQLRVEIDGNGTGHLLGDVNGDGVADFELLLAGLGEQQPLQAADFFL